jgi:hypothetical protein
MIYINAITPKCFGTQTTIFKENRTMLEFMVAYNTDNLGFFIYSVFC